MRRILPTLLATLSLGAAATAQVSDVNVIVAPTTSYTLWSSKLNLGDTPFYGIRAGFGFGPLFEVRGMYERSYDLKGKLQGSSWNVLGNLGDKLEGSEVKMERFGGELKLNLWSNAILTPYLSAGAGIMTMRYTDVATPGQTKREEHLYGALGGGLKINFSRRIALSLEARNYLFNIDPTNPYLAPGASSDKTLHNWSGVASLDIYLGGRRYDDDQVSRAYRDMFGDGFRGLKFVLEPGVAYLNMRDAALIGDTWLVGGSAGLDFSDLVGIRGFYYRETKDPSKLSLSLGKTLEMYGGNLIGRLNVARGVTPYLNLGVGYLKTNSQYIDTQANIGLDLSGWFALGGLGVEVPLHRSVALYGVANAILLEQDNPKVSHLTSPSSVNINWLMQAGVRINIGAISRSGVEAYRHYASSQVEATNAARLEELNALRSNYQARIDALNADLVLAAERLDTAEMALIATRKAQAAQELRRVDEATTQLLTSTEVGSTALETMPLSPSSRLVVMTPQQLDSLVSRVLSAADRLSPSTLPTQSLSDIDKILLIGAMRQGQLPPALAERLSHLYNGSDSTATTESSEVLRRLEAIEARLNQASNQPRVQQLPSSPLPVATSQEISLSEKGSQTSVAPTALSSSSGTTKPEAMYVAHLDPSGEVQVARYEAVSFLRFRSLDVYAGAGFGDASTLQVGIRPQWEMGASRFHLAPEMFVSTGRGTGYGLGANVIYKPSLLRSSNISPYLGLGLGYSHIGDAKRFGLSGAIGISFDKVLGGRFFVDYSLRPAFRNHHFSAGYSFTF